MNDLPITDDTFDAMDTDSKLNVLFDLARSSHKELCALSKRKRVDKALSITGGIIGGFIAIIGKWVLWK